MSIFVIIRFSWRPKHKQVSCAVNLKSFCWNRFVELSTGSTNSGREERWLAKNELGLGL